MENCPVCPRHCQVDDLKCDRGRTYQKTGKMPETKKRLKFDDSNKQMIMKHLHHAVGIIDNGHLNDDDTKDIFSSLSDEEVVVLKELLEKFADHLIVLEKSKESK